MVLSPGAGIASAAGKSALHASAGYSRGRLCKCRKRFSAGVPGAVAPGKINLESPPSRREERSASAGRGDGGGKASKRQGRQATKNASPPPGAWFAPFPSAARVQARGCKGRSPLHENNLNLPLPRRGRGRGDGATKTTNGRGSRRQRRQAPRRIQRRQGQPAPQGASPPTGCGITLPCPTKKEKIHCRRKIARTPCALPPNMLY